VGKKRDSVRTLPNGRRVVHHPDGEQDLIPTDRAERRLESDSGAAFARVAELREEAQRAAREKRESLDAGDTVPHDKRPI
jgi:hypothetical protein